jgi:nucleotide-binding universal stress UspA family protein
MAMVEPGALVRRIVAGVDGSAQSQRALQWAVDEATAHDAEVEAVYVFEHTPSWQMYAYGEGVPVAGQEWARENREHTERIAQALVDEMVEKLRNPQPVPVSGVVVEDRRPARALVERSRGADMLVIGSRGRGGFTGLVLGSVGQQCAQHAQCALVILPLTDDDDGEDT